MEKKLVKVSIIVPVYNMEKTISRCLDSILQQDYHDYEVILINDGSNDGTSSICNEYVNKFKNLHYFSRDNKGISLTIKEGIERSSGQFLIFIDSDDYVSSTMVRTLVKAQESHNADIVQSGINYIRVDGSLRGQKRMGNKVIENKSKIFYSYFIEESMNKTLAAALFRKSLFQDVEFPDGSLSIDLQVLPFLLNNCNIYEQIDVQLYDAVQYPNSVSRGAFSNEMYIDRMRCNKILDNFFEQYIPEMKDYLYFRKSEIAVSLYDKLTKLKRKCEDKNEKLLELKKLFSSNYPLFKKSKYYNHFSKKKRVQLELFNISPLLYMMGTRIYSKYIDIHR